MRKVSEEVAVPRLAAVDAQTYWMSAKIPNDQFLLYAFAGAPRLDSALVEELRTRASRCPELGFRIADDGVLRYPRWVPGPVDSAQIVLHAQTGLSWSRCLDAVSELAAHQLDPRRAAWRLHLFGSVTSAPTGHPAVTLAVLQIAHALADGTRTAQLAGWLFGRDERIPEVPECRRGKMVGRAVAAARTHRQMERDIEDGLLPSPPPPRPVLLSNTAPEGPSRIRTLVCERSALNRGPTVTVSALVAIGSALAAHLRDRGDDPAGLGAEVPMAKPGARRARNHFRNVGVGLYPDRPDAERAEAILADLGAARRRAEHPATLAAGESFAAVPAPLLRWGVSQFDPAVRSPVVTGNTVVSSVNRGAADLRLGAAPVVLTAGYPALSPMMGLTHGVHGIGETIAVSVHASDSVMSERELADYVSRLGDELRPAAPR